jgi:hypothetical protein
MSIALLSSSGGLSSCKIACRTRFRNDGNPSLERGACGRALVCVSALISVRACTVGVPCTFKRACVHRERLYPCTVSVRAL